MKRLAGAFSRLSTIEPSFRVEGAWRGTFELDGHVVRCAVNAGEWLQLAAPLTGCEMELVRRQGWLFLPVKVIAGPALAAEMPVVDEVQSTFGTLSTSLRQGLARLVTTAEQPPAAAQDDADAIGRFAPTLEESTVIWRRDGSALVTSAGGATVVATSSGNSVMFRAEAMRVNAATGPAPEALTHLVLAVNARFRFARATLASGRLSLEVAVPHAVLTPPLVDHAVGAVASSFRPTKRACAALADDLVAEQYLAFHKQRKDAYADTHH